MLQCLPFEEKRGMLHCEQLCFKAASHQGMFSETSGSILSCYSILLPSTKLHAHSSLSPQPECRYTHTHTHTVITCDSLQFNTTYVSCGFFSFFFPSLLRGKDVDRARTETYSHWHCCSVFHTHILKHSWSGVCMRSPFFRTAVSCSRSLPEWEG